MLTSAIGLAARWASSTSFLIYDDGTGEAIKPPAEAYPSDEDVALLEARGVMTFVSYRNHNAVRLSQFHSVARRAIVGRLAGT